MSEREKQVARAVDATVHNLVNDAITLFLLVCMADEAHQEKRKRRAAANKAKREAGEDG